MTKIQILEITLLATVICAGSGYVYVHGADRRALKAEPEVAQSELTQMRTRYGVENRRVKDQLLKIADLERRLVEKR